VSDLARDAQWLLRSGRIDEAEQAFRRVLAESPFDVQALNIVALASLRMNQPAHARELLERAVQAHPEHGASHHHLGRAAEELGDFEAARRAYRRAIELRPDLPAARLHLGALLERLGESHAALVQYSRVLRDTQSQGKWIDRTTTPPALVPFVGRAAQVVREGGRALYFALIEPLVKAHGAAELARVAQALRIYLGEEKPAYPDERQRPTFLYFPGLPTAPWFDRGLFPWIDAVEAQTPAIQRELGALLGLTGSGERVFTSDEVEAHNLRGYRGAPTWTGHYLYRHGERREANCAASPVTAATLDAMPLCSVEGHGPEVLFSVFTPGTHLLPHKGVTNTRIVGHLPLVVPPDCALRVGGEEHVWQEGRIVVFDDTYDHEAWNRSDRVRVVLIFDLWNPHLTEVERDAVAKLVVAIGEFRAEMEAF
jgi:aspartate beta-hydroxylase